MEAIRTDFSERIKFHRELLARSVIREAEAEKVMDFIAFLPDLRSSVAEVKISSDYSAPIYITVTVENYPIELTIEHLLGPLHRKYDILWEMKVDGDEKDPTFIFSPIRFRAPHVYARVKEGRFKSCRVTRIAKTIPQPSRRINEFTVECV